MRRYLLSRIAEIATLVQHGLYYLTEHADDEAQADGFDVYDVENGFSRAECEKPGHEKANRRSSVLPWMGGGSASFAGSRPE